MKSNIHHSIIAYSNFNKLPNHTLTHYISDAYPSKTDTPKTAEKKSARRPLNARKILTKTEKLMILEFMQIPSQETSHDKPTKSRKKTFNRINKTKIAEFFNDLNKQKQSREEWQTTIENMFKEIDRCKDEVADAERELLIDFVESVRTPNPAPTAEKHVSIWDDDDEYKGIDWVKEYARAAAYSSWDEIANYAHKLSLIEYLKGKPATSQKQKDADAIRNEINASVADRFVKKYRKQLRNKRTAHMLHNHFQKTK